MLKEEYIFLDVDMKCKEDILSFISEKAKQYHLTDCQEALYQDFLTREKEFSTGLKDGFAIPHARSDHVKDVAIMYLRNKSGIDWGTLDNQKVYYMFALLVPLNYDKNIHLKMLSKLATCLLEDEFKEKVKSSHNPTELKNYILQMIKEG